MKIRTCGWTLATVLAVGGKGAAAADAAEMFRCQRADGAIAFQRSPCPLPELAGSDPAPRARRTEGPAPAPVPPALRPVAPAPRPAEAAAVPASAPRAPVMRNVATTRRDGAGLKPPTDPSHPPPPPKLASVRGADEPYIMLTRRKREVLDLTARLERCRLDQPGFASRSGELYQAWRRRHEATLAEYEHLLSLKVREVRRSEAASLAQCSDEWMRSLEPLARPPDPRFATVEKTWSTFVAALLAADRDTLLRCVTGPAAERLKERIDRLADAELRRMGAAVRGLKVQWGDDYEKEGLVAHDDRVDGIAFRNVNEEWKIGNL